jgi:hypothetical protein
MQLLRIGAAAALVSGLLWLSPLKAQQPREQTTPSGAPMMVDKMMADMQASDAKLETLTAKMQMTQGEAKVLAMQDVVNELVKNQLDMHRHMMMMHQRMAEPGQK